MKIYVSKKDFFKESKEVQRAVADAIEDLYKRILSYKMKKIDFEKIFNDEKVKYDKHGDFYTFKTQKCNMQLRVLYTFFYGLDGTPTFLVADYAIKKKNNKKYITQFEWVAQKEISGLLSVAKPIQCKKY